MGANFRPRCSFTSENWPMTRRALVLSASISASSRRASLASASSVNASNSDHDDDVEPSPSSGDTCERARSMNHGVEMTAAGMSMPFAIERSDE